MADPKAWFTEAFEDERDQQLVIRYVGEGITHLYESAMKWSSNPQQVFQDGLLEELAEYKGGAGVIGFQRHFNCKYSSTLQ